MTNEETGVVDTPQVQAGILLQTKRQELGWSQQQVADRLCLKVSVIKKLENNDFSQLQVATFTRGYIRNYAKLVGIPESEIMGALDGCDSTQRKEQEMHSFSKKTNKEKHDSRIMLMTWGILIAIVGISVLWWFNERDNSELEQVQESTPATEVTEITEALPSLGEVVVTDSQTPSVAVDDTVTGLPTTEDSMTSTTESLVEAPAVVDELLDEAVSGTNELAVEDAAIEDVVVTEPQALPRLRIMLDGDCWLQVKDATGKTLAIGTKSAGEVLDFDQEGSYSLVLGAPQNVSITFASEPVDLSGYTAGKVARITLP
ncbi:RodZ domain-containing protein [Vibrio astriarenae]